MLPRILQVDHPALVLKRREPVEGDKARGTVSMSWLRSTLDEMLRSPTPTVYRRAYERWRSLLDERTVVSWIGTCSGRVLVGTGGTSILESGVALHHTYGVPYIPGSALKGLAAHYTDEVLGASFPADWRGPESPGNDSRQGEAHRLAFGTLRAAGLVEFLDAWLVPEPAGALVGDVVTPHHPEYYSGRREGGVEYWPADWDNPIPWPFLSVHGRFLFALESSAEPDALKLRDFVAERILKPALREWGVGGKTAAGYGRVEPP